MPQADSNALVSTAHAKPSHLLTLNRRLVSSHLTIRSDCASCMFHKPHLHVTWAFSSVRNRGGHDVCISAQNEVFAGWESGTAFTHAWHVFGRFSRLDYWARSCRFRNTCGAAVSKLNEIVLQIGARTRLDRSTSKLQKHVKA